MIRFLGALPLLLLFTGCSRWEKCALPGCRGMAEVPDRYCWRHEAPCLKCGRRIEAVPNEAPESLAVRLRYCPECRESAATCAVAGCSNLVPVSLSGKLVCKKCRDAMDGR